MNSIEYVRDLVIPAAFSMLPTKMDSKGARAMVLATGLQESEFKKRRQMGGGPARGFHQFEQGTPETRGGCAGVLLHPASKPYIDAILRTMGYDLSPRTSHAAIEHNDILDCAYARLLLWTSPLPLPKRGDAHGGWLYYINGWRPGKPHPGTWDAYYAQAWELVA